ncbi:MAG: hypothetical protein WCL51_17820 [Bacteroidota bacterium]
MKELPILFSTPMVQALLEGRKTMTRRVKGLEEVIKNPENVKEMFSNINHDFIFIMKTISNNQFDRIKCHARYSIGDFLWVRETFAPAIDDFAYKADYSESVLKEDRNKGLWKPSIFMPKTAARIWLKIIDVRVERLKDISEEDASKEGADGYIIRNHPGLIADKLPTAKDDFCILWKNINGYDSWDKNPWVWVYSFEVISKNGRPENI